MKRVIIGIHGLANKPEKRLLAEWWKAALSEGLERINKSRLSLPFEMSYWAHHIYSCPKSDNVADPEDSLLLLEPYVHAEGGGSPERSRRLKKRALTVLEKVMAWSLVSSRDPLRKYRFEDLLIKRRFPELDFYYNNSEGRLRIQQELRRLLENHRDDSVLLIAHSMGSIIAYDLLSASPELQVAVFVTIGSPLAISSVLKRAHSRSLTEKGEIRAVVPEAVTGAWWNFFDLEDRIAFNYTLNDDCLPNSRGVVPVDRTVCNDYSYRGIKNAHKSFGYLRTIEMAAVVAGFLESPVPGLWSSLRGFFRGLVPRGSS